MLPLVSFIVPIYNVAPYLRRCLDSLVGQTITDWEAICIDDGSSDGSAEILEEYAARDKRFKVYHQPNGGLSVARNVGMSHAQGTYINFVDSDDFIHPQTLELSVALAQRDQSDVVCWVPDMTYRYRLILRSRLGIRFDKVRPWSIHRRYRLEDIDTHCTDSPLRHMTNERHPQVAYPIQYFYVWRFLLRRELAIRYTFVPRLIFEDVAWWSELLLASPRITITHLPLYYYYYNAKSLTAQSPPSLWCEHWLRILLHLYPIYLSRATDEERTYWMRQCIWPILRQILLPRLKQIPEGASRSSAIASLKQLRELGLFDTAYNSTTKRVRDRIERYISVLPT